MFVQDVAITSTDCNSSTNSWGEKHSPGPARYVVCQISQIKCMRGGGNHGDGVSVEDAVGMIITFCPVLNGLKWAHLKAQHGGLLLQWQNPELHSWGPGLCRKSHTLLTRYCWKESAIENCSHPGIQDWFLLGAIYRWLRALQKFPESIFCHLALFGGQCFKKEVVGQALSLSFLLSLILSGRQEHQRWGVSAERKCQHNNDFTEKYYSPLWVFAGCCHIEMCGKQSDLSIASSSCSHPFRCLLLPPRQISEEGGCEGGGGE